MSSIRKAQISDEDVVFSLAVDFPAPTPIDRAMFQDMWRRKLSDSNSYIGVAEVDETVVGYVSGYAHATFYANGPTAWVDEILVREDMRGRGVGRRLMAEFARWSEEQGCKLIGLSTRGALEFYRALGYEGSATYYKKYL